MGCVFRLLPSTRSAFALFLDHINIDLRFQSQCTRSKKKKKIIIKMALNIRKELKDIENNIKELDNIKKQQTAFKKMTNEIDNLTVDREIVSGIPDTVYYGGMAGACGGCGAFVQHGHKWGDTGKIGTPLLCGTCVLGAIPWFVYMKELRDKTDEIKI